MKISVGRQIQIAFLFALIILIALGIYSYRSAKTMNSALSWEKHTQEALLKLDDVLSLAIDVETGGRGYIITGNEEFLEPYDQASQNIKRNLQELENLVSDNPAQKAELKNLAEKVGSKTNYTKNLIETRRTNGIESAREIIESGREMKIMGEIRSSIKKMKNEEKRLLQTREKKLNDSISNTLILLFLGISLGVVSLVFVNFAIGRETKKRFAAEDDLRQTNKDLEERVEQRTKELRGKNDELEDQITRSEQIEKYRQIALEAGSLGTWIFDPETDSVDLDERGLSIFGLSEMEFDGLRNSVFNRIHEEDLPLVEKLFQKSLTEKSKFNAQFRVIYPDETVRWNQCTGQLQLDENGNIKQVIGNCRDITDSKKSELILKRSEQNVRNIIDNLFAFVGVLSPDGTLLEANRTALEAASLKLEDVIGKTFADTYWWSYSKEIQQQLKDSIKKAASGERVRYDVNVRIGDNRFIPIDFMMAPLFDDDGNITHLIPSGLDLTPRKEAEDALRRSENFANAILNSLTAHVAVVDKNGNIVAVNDAWTKFAKDNSDENQNFSTGIGQNYLTVCQSSSEANEGVSQVAKNLKAILDDEKDSFNHEYPCHSPTENRWFMLQINSMKGEEGGAVISHIDITDRKEAERERERLHKNEKSARKDAEIANRMRDEFLATVSHELRAPLNSILGWGRLMQKGKLDEPTTEKAVDTIVRNAESQNRLIEDLLDVSRIISGKLRLEVMTIKPINIVESALETIRPAAEAKGITLEVKQDADVSHISGDMNRLQQVLWNLLSNAIKFTPNDGKVTLEIEREEDFVNLHIKDTGVGIKEEFLPFVFDRFRQADASSIRKFGGLGLGLAIVRHITEMHGGTVHVTSEGEGKGSTFTVRLPLVVSPDESDSEVRPSAENIGLERDSKMSLDELLILVVDDEEDTRQLLKQALTFYGATVITADSAANALIEIQDKNPDVIVSDIGMPEEDGYSLIRKIRNLNDSQQKQTPAIALTAFTRAKDRMQALSAGYQNHVSKPVEPDELITVIASITGRLQSSNEDEN